MSTTMNRRSIVKAATGLAAVGMPRWFVEDAVFAQDVKLRSANDTLAIALIGCGGRGTGDARQAAKHGKIVALCDVDDEQLGRAKLAWPDATAYKDFRKLLERKDIDVIVNGTPDHWHTLVNMAAMKSGRDVYSEKPLTLTIDEGKRLVQVARATNRILQTGSQQRSDANFRLACELVVNGRIGQLQHVDVWLPHGRREGPFKPSVTPGNLDWEMWQGQTPKVDYVKERTHVTFRYWWEYSGGTMTDWGAHHLDIALWGTGYERSGPVSVEAKPLVKMIPGGFTAHSEYEVHYTYANGVTQTCMSTTANAWNGSVLKPDGQQHGVRFNGSGGWIFVTRGKIEASDPSLLSTPLPSSAQRLVASDDHMQNFFDCVRSRKSPICDAQIGHRSVSVCHLGVIALRLGRKLAWDPAKEEFVNDPESNQWLSREMRAPWTYDLT